jgi:hypothetical protein
MSRCLTIVAVLATSVAAPVAAQVQVRLEDSTHATYSELHEALRDGTPAADSVRGVLEATSAPALWPLVRRAADGSGDWNTGLLALTRIAELRDPASGDSAARWRERIARGTLRTPPGIDPADLLPPLHAIELELECGRQGAAALLAALLPRIPSGNYDLADAWLFGRLGAGAADTVAARFLSTSDRDLRIRYLTLLSFSRDTTLIPLLARIYVAPDSFGLPPRAAIRASDGLLWIGTRASLQSLLDARAAARARGIYADPRLGHAELDFLGSDSSAVVSRTGRWLTEWLARLR